MSEITLDLRHLPKPEAYAELDAHVRATLAGITDPIAAMATISCLVHHAFGHLWSGFYRVVDPGKLLRVGPYQGTLGCLEIAFGRGVCGTAAAEGRTVVVEDVFDACGDLLAVFDVDSEHRATFDDADREGLERILSWFRTAA